MEGSYISGIELVTGALIENEKGEILLTQSSKWREGTWVFPGGHLEPGESILEACVREGQEETGLALEGVRILSYGELIGSPDFLRPAHFVYFHALCRVKGGEVVLDAAELQSSRWCRLEEALSLDLPVPYRKTLELYRAGG